MSETKFTPGPWTQGRLLMTESVRNRWTQEMRDEGDRQERLMVFANFTANDEGRSRYLIAQCNTEKDAHLISAAPDLYKLLAEKVAWMDSGDEVGAGCPWHIAATAALKGARGEE